MKTCIECINVNVPDDDYPCDICTHSSHFKPSKLDNVNSPKHYTSGKIEVIDFIEDQKLGFHEANVVKYVCRHKLKNGIEDLKKARWYLDRVIKQMEVDECQKESGM